MVSPCRYDGWLTSTESGNVPAAAVAQPSLENADSPATLKARTR
jgi:hypothetical protein